MMNYMKVLRKLKKVSIERPAPKTTDRTWAEYMRGRNTRKCMFNGEILNYAALVMRFRRGGNPHPGLEANKYLISSDDKETR